MVGSLTAVLAGSAAARGASMRLNTLEFAGMLGVLGGLAVVGLLPASAGPGTSRCSRLPRRCWWRSPATLVLARYVPARLSAAAPGPRGGARGRGAGAGRRRCRRSCASCSRSA